MQLQVILREGKSLPLEALLPEGRSKEHSSKCGGDDAYAVVLGIPADAVKLRQGGEGQVKQSRSRLVCALFMTVGNE